MAWHYEGGEVCWDDWALVAVLGTPEAGVSTVNQLVDLTSEARVLETRADGCRVEVRLVDTSAVPLVTFFVAARCATSRIPNYLLEQSARRFVDVGCEPLFRAFGKHFGTTVKYIFFDQPHANFYDWPQRFGNLRSSLPYAEELQSFVEARTGASIGQLLMALLEDIGERTPALRAGFYAAYTELACRAYLGTMADWAKRRHIALSGHEVLGHVGSWHPSAAFGNWDLRVNFGLDYFGVDSYRGITGVDAQDCVPQLSTKLGDSVARSHGRSRCIVEQYLAGRTAGSGAYTGHWGLTLEELRAQALRLEILGARQFLYHGFYQTDGNDSDFTRLANPRFDFPPGINFEPWWPYYLSFAEEAGRLSVFLDGADPACEIALFYPLRTAWFEGSDHSYGDHLAFWASYLAERGFGYHLIDERDLKMANVRAGALQLGDRRYECLVLPSVTTLESVHSLAAVEALAAGGGLVVSSGDTPSYLQEGAPGEAAAFWLEKIARAEGLRYLMSVPSRTEADALLLALLKGRPYVPQRDGDVPLWQWSGWDGVAWRVALFNDSTMARSAELVVPWDRCAVERWWPTNGARSPWVLGTEVLGHKGHVAIRLDAMELCCVRVREAEPNERLSPAMIVPALELPPEDHALEMTLADGWTLELPEGSGPAQPVPISVASGWERQGFPHFSGVGRYRRSLELPKGVHQVMLELPVVHTVVEVRLNGTSAGCRAWSPYRFLLSSRHLRPGTNELELLVASAAGNKYYGGTPFDPGPEPSGLGAPPRLLVWTLKGATSPSAA
jgi:hypothetical protein